MERETDPRTAALLENTRWLRALAQRLVGADEADDLVQEVLVAGWGAPHVPRNALRTWLASVARRMASTRHRRAAARLARERAVARGDVVPAPTALEQAELQRTLLDAVLALDEPYRGTVLARFVEGLEISAIAQREGLAVASIRSRLARAYEQLRRRLDGEFGGRERWAMLVAPAAGPALALGSLGPAAGLALAAGVLVVGLLGLRAMAIDAPRPSIATAAARAQPTALLREGPREASTTTREAAARDVEGGIPVPDPQPAWSGPWSLTGTVLHQDRPVPGAAVLWADLSHEIVLDRVVTTDASGRYVIRFADEAQARSAVVVSARQGDLFADPDRPGPFHQGVATADLWLWDVLTTLVLVRDEDGRPLENVELSLAPGLDLACETDPSGDEVRAWRRVLRGSQAAHGRTDAQGECRLVTPVTVVKGALSAWKEGYRLLSHGRFLVDPAREEARAAWEARMRREARHAEEGLGVMSSRETRPAPRQGLLVETLVLERGAPLIVRLVDAQGASVPGAEVRAGDFTVRMTRVSDAQGRIEFPEFPPRPRALHVEADVPGFAPLRVMVSETDSRWNDGDELVLALSRATTIAVRLVDSGGSPISSGTACLKADDPLADHLGALEDPVAVAADGGVRWEDVPETCGDLWLLVPGFEPAWLPWAARARGVGSGERLVLTPARTWIVEITAAESDAPIRDATIEVSFEYGASSGHSIRKSFLQRAPRGQNRVCFDSSTLLDAGGARPVRCALRVKGENRQPASWTLSSPELRAESGVRAVRLEQRPEPPVELVRED